MAVSQEQGAAGWSSDPGLLTSNLFSAAAQLPTFVLTYFPGQAQERLTSSEERLEPRLDLYTKFDGLVHDCSVSSGRHRSSLELSLRH